MPTAIRDGEYIAVIAKGHLMAAKLMQMVLLRSRQATVAIKTGT
jgi:hypothetical protein